MLRKILGSAVLALLAACGGGGGGSGGSGDTPAGPAMPTAACGPTANDLAINPMPSGPVPTEAEAARFLAQASMGPNTTAITSLRNWGSINDWITREYARDRSSHLAFVDAIYAARVGDTNPDNNSVSQDDFLASWWSQAITCNDQLRQRVSFALSQIFVVSFEGNLSNEIRGVSAYYDMLSRNAFGNYRTLLEEVSLHPAMGQYLSHLRNRKEDAASGRVPDENYAREVMQLFSIGLYRLNADGSLQMSGGNPIETYTNADVTGLARVFTGYSWNATDTSNSSFNGSGAALDPNRQVVSMKGYPQHHSTAEKAFLGVTIPQQSSATPASMASDLDIALDTLANHPNVGPFIGRQLIQRLVTSNPSPAYIGRVTAAFNNNGSGVRGDLKAVIRAVLTDPEARPANPGTTHGKLREPVLRYANWARATNAISTSGQYRVGSTNDPANSLGQTPMRSPSVFNFFRPGYVPPGTETGAAGLFSPELQITHETTVAGYLNRIQGAISSTTAEVRSNYTELLALADQPAALMSKVDLLFTNGMMSTTTRTEIQAAVADIAIRTNNATNTANDKRNRVNLAVFLAMASPEYLVQK